MERRKDLGTLINSHAQPHSRKKINKSCNKLRTFWPWKTRRDKKNSFVSRRNVLIKSWRRLFVEIIIKRDLAKLSMTQVRDHKGTIKKIFTMWFPPVALTYLLWLWVSGLNHGKMWAWPKAIRHENPSTTPKRPTTEKIFRATEVTLKCLMKISRAKCLAIR